MEQIEFNATTLVPMLSSGKYAVVIKEGEQLPLDDLGYLRPLARSRWEWIAADGELKGIAPTADAAHKSLIEALRQ